MNIGNDAVSGEKRQSNLDLHIIILQTEFIICDMQ